MPSREEGLGAEGALEGLVPLGVHAHVLLEGVPAGEVGATLGAGQQGSLAPLVTQQVPR